MAAGDSNVAINFGALNKSREADTLVDPRDIFNALPTKPPGMNFLRGPQDQVLEKWFARKEQRDVVVKLNTGGGKTVVGLLIARSSLAEGKGPVAYLVPDKYLVDQVVAEAGRLGIAVATDPKAFAYSRGKAILVDTFQTLFNGKSVFGVSGGAGRTPSATRPHTVGSRQPSDTAYPCTLRSGARSSSPVEVSESFLLLAHVSVIDCIPILVLHAQRHPELRTSPSALGGLR